MQTVPRIGSAAGEFCYFGPVLWNKLTDDLKSVTTVCTFNVFVYAWVSGSLHMRFNRAATYNYFRCWLIDDLSNII